MSWFEALVLGIVQGLTEYLPVSSSGHLAIGSALFGIQGEENLAFSFQLEYQAAQYYPQFYRGIYLAGYRYNLHLRPRSLLLEAGAQTNTVQEVKNAMEPFADILDKVLQG